MWLKAQLPAPIRNVNEGAVACVRAVICMRNHCIIIRNVVEGAVTCVRAVIWPFES